ncbi:Two-component system histidine kinase [Streptococcus mitis]|uniref:Two-component system histidine kinase n=1 Tax=Streptococcus mitis TaxID=28037 RepID=A0A150NM52_STRMT|nr:Two-component system histidine kinase [Streptococcus mitis]
MLVVIEQIISNSLKYTKEGGLEIYMEGQELCIKDTGIGIKTVMSSESLNVASQDIMDA